ncbi:MAG: sigma-70 family RNA polymerase sigma factor [Chloroflexi bacterium]|nr:sigma-70 family RNA polymerase sigma factor [Chloroflexota bacterium]
MEPSLVERARSGDREAFSAIAFEVSDGLFAVAHRVLRDFDAAADALQVALVRMWRDLPGLSDPNRFEAWAYRVLIRACHDAIRARRPPGPQLYLVAGDRATVADHAGDVVARDELDHAFRRLTPDQRAILVLQYYRDLKLEDIASLLQIPIGTVRSRLFYAKQALRSALEADSRPVITEIVR